MLAFSMRKFFWGLIVVAVGGLIWADNLGMVNISFKFTRDWPVIIVALGLGYMWEALFGKHWWGAKFGSSKKERRENLARILEDLEKGSISADEAARKMEK
ncbi:MAG: DUF5668 domain-containing protein [Elusimicrobiota bacterium]|nr:DUF5668 domain-containing protein [Elusimicrobiota bacterium]